MKKIYMKPEIFVAKVEMDVMLSAVSDPKVMPHSGDNPPTAAQKYGMDAKGRGDYDYEGESNFGDLW